MPSRLGAWRSWKASRAPLYRFCQSRKTTTRSDEPPAIKQSPANAATRTSYVGPHGGEQCQKSSGGTTLRQRRPGDLWTEGVDRNPVTPPAWTSTRVAARGVAMEESSFTYRGEAGGSGAGDAGAGGPAGRAGDPDGGGRGGSVRARRCPAGAAGGRVRAGRAVAGRDRGGDRGRAAAALASSLADLVEQVSLPTAASWSSGSATGSCSTRCRCTGRRVRTGRDRRPGRGDRPRGRSRTPCSRRTARRGQTG